MKLERGMYAAGSGIGTPEKGFYENRLELFKKAEQEAKKLYGDIPYHNFDHASEAVELGYEICARCQAEVDENGKPKKVAEVDTDLVRYALLFHDAGYHEDHVAKGFSSKEEYSAHLADVTLNKLGLSREIIEKVKDCIVSTHKDKPFDVLEEKIVRAADLAGLAFEYEKFKENAIKLKEELEIMSGSEIPMENWKESVKNIIGFYLNQEIQLTECYHDDGGESVFHKKTRANLERFLKEDI